MKKWRIEHQEDRKKYMKEYNKKYHLEHKIERKKDQRKYRLKHIEYYNEYMKKYMRKYQKRHGIKFIEKHREQQKKYNHTFKGKLNHKKHKAKRRVNGIIKKGTIEQLVNNNILKYGMVTCEKCNKECECNFNIDHIIPVSKGGTNDYDNLQILCAKCNLEKATKTVDYRQNIEDNQIFLKI